MLEEPAGPLSDTAVGSGAGVAHLPGMAVERNPAAGRTGRDASTADATGSDGDGNVDDSSVDGSGDGNGGGDEDAGDNDDAASAASAASADSGDYDAATLRHLLAQLRMVDAGRQVAVSAGTGATEALPRTPVVSADEEHVARAALEIAVRRRDELTDRLRQLELLQQLMDAQQHPHDAHEQSLTSPPQLRRHGRSRATPGAVDDGVATVQATSTAPQPAADYSVSAGAADGSSSNDRDGGDGDDAEAGVQQLMTQLQYLRSIHSVSVGAPLRWDSDVCALGVTAIQLFLSCNLPSAALPAPAADGAGVCVTLRPLWCGVLCCVVLCCVVELDAAATPRRRASAVANGAAAKEARRSGKCLR